MQKLVLKMHDAVASEDPLLIIYCPDKYKSQRMCADDWLSGSIKTCSWLVCYKQNAWKTWQCFTR